LLSRFDEIKVTTFSGSSLLGTIWLCRRWQVMVEAPFRVTVTEVASILVLALLLAGWSWSLAMWWRSARRGVPPKTLARDPDLVRHSPRGTCVQSSPSAGSPLPPKYTILLDLGALEGRGGDRSEEPMVKEER
jgi:hypothetical protein